MSIKLMSAVWDHKDLRAGTPVFEGGPDAKPKSQERKLRCMKFILLALADYSNEDGECWPKVQTVAEKCNLSEKYTRSLLGALERNDWLERNARFTKDSSGAIRQVSNTYSLNVPRLMEAFAPPTSNEGRSPLPNEGRSPLPNEGRQIHHIDPPKETTTESSSEFGEICTVYESNIGLLTPMIGDKIKDAMGDYPTSWIVEGIQAAVTAEARHWNYVLGCLKNWKREGKSTVDKQEEKEANRKTYVSAGSDLE